MPLTACAVFAAVSLGTVAGCGLSASRIRDTSLTRLGEWSYGGWLSDYETARERAKTDDRPLLLFYKRPGADDEKLKDSLSTMVRGSDGVGYVRCVLVRSHEPDRRYVAQFGVERAPAVIVVHRDGTFHARSGRFTPDEAIQFVESAAAPGAMPRANPLIPPRSDYSWFTSLREAGLQAANTDRPLLIAYERRLRSDSNELEPLLESLEVRRRFADMIPCRLMVWNAWSDPYDSPFGFLHLPAVIIVWPDGRTDILQRPVSSEAIVRFADDARALFEARPARTVGTESEGDAPSFPSSTQ